MRRIALISWLVLCSAVICGGVGAMVAVKPAAHGTAHSIERAHLAPIDEFPLPKGHIVAVDDRAGKITIRHKGVQRFELPAQTCVFPVGDRTLLSGLTPGDKIRFDLQRENGHLVVTHIENSN